jgi:hypothetical protein
VIVSAFVTAGIVASGVATCSAGAMMPETAQMACCKAGHHACGKDGAPADCCGNHSSPEPEYNRVAKTDSLKAPARLFLALVSDNPIADAAAVVQPLCPASTSPPVEPPGPPVYIVLSTLLL